MIRYFHQSLDDSVGAPIGVEDAVSEGEADGDEFAELTLPLVLPNTLAFGLPLPFEFALPFVIGFVLAFVFVLAGVFKFVLSGGFGFIFPLELSGGRWPRSALAWSHSLRQYRYLDHPPSQFRQTPCTHPARRMCE